MSLRIKVLAVFTLMIAAVVGGMVWGVERYARAQFQEFDQQRSDALVAQFRRELSQRGAEVSNSLQSIADAESTLRMVLELSRPQADPSVYANDARGLAKPRHLDFLELVADDGTMISSSHWPERIGYKNDWVTHGSDWNQQSAFLDRVELSNRVELGLLAVRMVHVGDRNFYIIGGQRLDSEFLRTLAFPTGMRALLYRNFEEGFVPSALGDADGPLLDAQPFAPVIEALKKGPQATEQKIELSTGLGKMERFVTLPLNGRRGELLGALLLGSAQDQLVALVNYIRGRGLMIATAAIFLGFVMSWWISARVAGPLRRLEGGIADVTAGDWDTQVQVRSSNEVRRVIRAFNTMTGALVETRSNQSARERVSAWRELAGGLASEFEDSISPAIAAVEKLAKTHGDAPGNLDAVAAESDAELRNSLQVLRAKVQRLDNFASMPAPRLQAVNVNEVVRDVVKSLEPQFRPSGHPPINPELFLDAGTGTVRADPDLIKKAFENLFLHALTDMPTGGTLNIRTRQHDGMVRMMVSDTGHGLELENKNRRFSPYGTSRLLGLGLAVAQAIVTDHGGTMSVESAPGAGMTVFIDLPIATATQTASAGSQPALPRQKPIIQLVAPADAGGFEPVAEEPVNAEEELVPAPQALVQANHEPQSEAAIEIEAAAAEPTYEQTVEAPVPAESRSSDEVPSEPTAEPTAETEAAMASTDGRLAEPQATEALPIEARLEMELQAELESLADAIFYSDAAEELADAVCDPEDTNSVNDEGHHEAHQEINLSRTEKEPPPEKALEAGLQKDIEEVPAETQAERAWPPPLTYR